MIDQTCSKCDSDLERPYEQHANYVISDDFAEPREVVVHYGMYHTKETKEHLQMLYDAIPNKTAAAIAAEMADPDAPETITVTTGELNRIETKDDMVFEEAVTEEVNFSYPAEKFDHRRLSDVEAARQDSNCAYIYTETEEVAVEKTGLICSGCTADDDRIIWGVDR